jgi:hypothetical protein
MKETFFILSALTVSIIHSLMPEHWLPFVLTGRVRKWKPFKTAIFTLFSMGIHVGSSLLIGFFIFFGVKSAIKFGEIIEIFAIFLLILFGIYYLLPERLAEKIHSHKHGDTTEGIYLTVAIGMHPCLFIAPTFLTIASSLKEFYLAALALSIPTLFLPPITVWLILKGLLGLRWGFLDRYGKLISGIIILLLGLFLLIEHH